LSQSGIRDTYCIGLSVGQWGSAGRLPGLGQIRSQTADFCSLLEWDIAWKEKSHRGLNITKWKRDVKYIRKNVTTGQNAPMGLNVYGK
jgi:hypothetical protein